MLDDIRLHIDSDEEKQSELERLHADKLHVQLSKNKRAFLRYAAGLRPILEKAVWQNYGIFFNKNGEPNLVDALTGTAVYGRFPTQEISRQYTHFLSKPIEVELSDNGSESCLVILGVGLGYHLQSLLESSQDKFIIIYEPEIQFFLASCFFFDWEKVLKLAEEKGVTFFFQIGSDGKNIKSDLSELRAHCELKKFSVYQHYNTDIFFSIADHARYYRDRQFFEYAIEWNRGEAWMEYLPVWTPPSEFDCSATLSKNTHERFENNIRILGKNFPQLAHEFREFTPIRWRPVETSEGELTLQHIESEVIFCAESPLVAGKDNYNNFTQYPNKDGLVLGYNGEKLLPYLHYQFVTEANKLLEGVEDETASFPESVKSLILFGMATGYNLAELVSNHDIDALLVCEPEPDFFYGALLAIDFEPILDDFNKRNARLYFNIGDDGTNLYTDLMYQFHAIGPYVLQDTYFYQTYSRKDFSKSIAALREQLQIVVSAGEYFDHARYGIEHTRHVLKEGCFIQKKQTDIPFTPELHDKPVFIIGNGPSLDREMDFIRSIQDRVIIVSCGTSIKPLALNDIKPDIHVEVEQNRSTYDWLIRANCRQVLSETVLLSCNGIHPDVVELFKDVFVCLKNGESSTEVAELSLGKDKFESLEHGFPTVTNLAVNAIAKLNFKNVYFFGTDLAFLSDTEHHSKQSGYYDENGKELYNYAKKNNSSIVVPGNFGGFLTTKYEFKLSKRCLEDMLLAEPVEYFNCSQGALIEGAKPLRSSEIKLPKLELDKQALISLLKEVAYSTSQEALSHIDNNDVLHQFDVKEVENDIDNLFALTDRLQESQLSVDEFIIEQKQLMVGFYENKRSLSFYLFYGTNNYVLSTFSKLSGVTQKSKLVTELLDLWRNFLNKVKYEYLVFPDAFDFICSFSSLRELALVQADTEPTNVYFNIDVNAYVDRLGISNSFKPKNMIFSHSNSFNNTFCQYVFVVFEDSAFTQMLSLLSELKDNAKVLLFTNNLRYFDKLKQVHPCILINILYSPFIVLDENTLQQSFDGERGLTFVKTSLVLIPKIISTEISDVIFVPKLLFSENADSAVIENCINDIFDSIPNQFSHFYSYQMYSCLNIPPSSHYVDKYGNRAKLSSKTYSSGDLVASHRHKKERFESTRSKFLAGILS